MNESGTLYLVSSPIGNLADLTHRAVEVLMASDTILAEDTRRTRILLDHYGISTSDIRSFHQHNEARRTTEIRAVLEAGGTVALISDSGTPLISDPGLRLVRAALEVGADVVPVPGPSAVLAALVSSGLDPQPFTFLGFVPRSAGERQTFFSGLGQLEHTAVFFESAQRLVRTLKELGEHVGDQREVVVARELTKLHEEFRRGTLAEAIAYYEGHAPRGEVVVCLAGARARPEEEMLDEARAQALAMARGGASSKEIVRALRDRFDIDRNRAYAIALEVVKGTR